MPGLKQVWWADAPDKVVKFHDRIFGDRDPVTEPATAIGTRGNWWSAFVPRPYILDHATRHFGMFVDKSISQFDSAIRELAIMSAGYAQRSQIVFLQHCKAARKKGVSEKKLEAISHWQVANACDERERSVPAWGDVQILQECRASHELFEAIHKHFLDEDILVITHHVPGYNLHVVSCKALRLEFDDVDERLRKVPASVNGEPTGWAGHAWNKGTSL